MTEACTLHMRLYKLFTQKSEYFKDFTVRSSAVVWFTPSGKEAILL